MTITDLLNYGFGVVALREIWKLRSEMKAGLDNVTAALRGQEKKLENHEERIQTLEEDERWRSS